MLSLHTWSYKIDNLGMIMLFLIAYIGLCVIGYSSRYLAGDTRYRAFFVRITVLICAVSIMVTTDNLWALLMSLCLSNFTIVTLMIHKAQWQAARTSGIIAAKTYLLSLSFMTGAFALLYTTTNQTSITAILHCKNHSTVTAIALSLLLIAAMAQSAIWPFHKWLISSLNSPTPVSAIMHAGLINAGGFLLVRFAPLYAQHALLMHVIFIVGISSALLGTLWKLMQSNVKRMLACSTMGQMGFMFAQVGLGLFPLAIVHLFWHGMFKAYLFLASGSSGQDQGLDLAYSPKILAFIGALCCGAFGSFIFALTANKAWLANDSTLVLTVIVFLAGSQLALGTLRKLNYKNFILAIMMTLTAAIIYGASTRFIMWILRPMNLIYLQPLHIFHISGIGCLIIAWLLIIFVRNPRGRVPQYSQLILQAYVKALNASQPHPGTITAARNHYHY